MSTSPVAHSLAAYTGLKEALISAGANHLCWSSDSSGCLQALTSIGYARTGRPRRRLPGGKPRSRLCEAPSDPMQSSRYL